MRGNRADAEDALEQSMLKALAQLPRFASRIVELEAWLVVLTRNTCSDIRRARKRVHRTEQRVLPADEPLIDEVDPAPLIARLPDALREVFVLRVLRGMTYRDVASTLLLTAATARKRVQQARAALRALRDGGPSVARRSSTPARVMAANPVSRTVSVQTLSGRAVEIEIVLDRAPSRERQKIAT